ncbi:MAG: bacteriohemerythrin [Zoogloeaceae bacterium]|jgi:hemerythrin|nr:bacteriohemerythrin [Zoogloeaceae bacterium]
MADLITWSDDLSIGVQEIDEQHKVLVSLLNELHSAVYEHHGSEACNMILNRLIEYTRIHFTTEESVMRLLLYPEFEHHKMEHDALTNQVIKFQTRLVSGQTSMSFQLLHFLKVWLTKHIQESDRRCGAYLLERGVAASWAPHVEETMKKKWWKLW